jgi:peptidoglycan/LPS O-acetylase OafA/YrhL
MRLNYFDYFRAIAIIIIVAGHSFSLWVIDTLPEKVLANIITGGTSLFVFISGFFFITYSIKTLNIKYSSRKK